MGIIRCIFRVDFPILSCWRRQQCVLSCQSLSSCLSPICIYICYLNEIKLSKWVKSFSPHIFKALSVFMTLERFLLFFMVYDVYYMHCALYPMYTYCIGFINFTWWVLLYEVMYRFPLSFRYKSLVMKLLMFWCFQLNCYCLSFMPFFCAGLYSHLFDYLNWITGFNIPCFLSMKQNTNWGKGIL